MQDDKLTPLLWDDSFLIGIEAIDAQHQDLFTRLNELLAAGRRDASRDVLQASLDSFAAAIETHFSYEEKLFLKSAYPEGVAHKAEHDRLRQELFAIQSRFHEVETGRVAEDLFRYLKNWLTYHIKAMDRTLGPFWQDEAPKSALLN